MTYKQLIICLAVIYFVFGCGSGEDDSSLKNLDVDALNAQTHSAQNLEQSNNDITNSRRNAITMAIEKANDAIVGINVTQIRESRRSLYSDDPFFRFFYPGMIPRQAVKSLGSGFVISADGYILTNEHVVHNASEIVVALADGTTENADLIGSDYITDIALIKIRDKDYPFVRLGDSDDIIIGEWVIAVGNPFGLFEINAKPTVTVGVVSAVDRDFGRQRNDRVYQDMIQTDAAINQGNSGGPLLNSLGEVIGINTFIYTGNDYNTGSIGLGFAIPSNRIIRVLKDLKQYGEVNRRWTTGLSVEEIPPMVARYFRLQANNGVIVTNVEKDSPAYFAKIESGDIIVAINEKKIQNENDIWKVIDNSDLRGGDKLNLTVIRDKKTQNFILILKEIKRK